MPTGLPTGKTETSSASSRTRSASLPIAEAARPGVEPARPGTLHGREPDDVPGREAAVRPRCTASGAHGGEHVATRGRAVVDRQRRADPGRQHPAGLGPPKPIFSSTSGLIDTELPASASIASWSSESPLPCTMVVRSSSSPRSCISAIGRRLRQPPVPWTCTLTRSPSSRASATSAVVCPLWTPRSAQAKCHLVARQRRPHPPDLRRDVRLFSDAARSRRSNGRARRAAPRSPRRRSPGGRRSGTSRAWS